MMGANMETLAGHRACIFPSRWSAKWLLAVLFAPIASLALATEPETVTIQAQRQELRHQIGRFVSRVVVTYMNDSLERWDTPICPLVAGLSSERGEFILARISQIANTAHAPLAPEHCRPNFYVVLTANPDLLVRKWWKRDRNLVNTCNGMGYVREFMRARGPVRVWYNTHFLSSDGAQLSAQSISLDIAGLNLDPCASATNRAEAARLRYSQVQALSSVIIVIDTRRTTHLNIGQLADYIAMIGLAQIRLDADTGTAPTILRLFRASDRLPQGLSPWDQAFLHSLYTTDQTNVLQISTIKTSMLQQIEP